MEPVPSSLIRDISPPRTSKRQKLSHNISQGQTSPKNLTSINNDPNPAAVEAGKAEVEDHLSYFKEHLFRALRVTEAFVPRISIHDFSRLYEQNQHPHGSHFVIHQHEHPRAGLHYDLRLQFSQTSSLSFAIPKGLPGNPNSISRGRMAIETRVHNLWNNLIESASSQTGSLLIWDTGTYTVLPRTTSLEKSPSPQTTDNETDSESRSQLPARFTFNDLPNNERLIEAFQNRFIRLRLHGTRLPKNYTVNLMLPSANNFASPIPRIRKSHKRRRTQNNDDTQSTLIDSSLSPDALADSETYVALDSDIEEDMTTRFNNAYPGSTNSINSVHQRKWFMLLDRRSSGFRLGRTGRWEREGEAGFETFYVQGRDVERSVVTGRLARDVENDEGLEGYTGRKGWVGITH